MPHRVWRDHYVRQKRFLPHPREHLPIPTHANVPGTTLRGPSRQTGAREYAPSPVASWRTELPGREAKRKPRAFPARQPGVRPLAGSLGVAVALACAGWRAWILHDILQRWDERRVAAFFMARA